MTACNAARHTDIEIREILEQQFEVVLGQIVDVVDAEIRAGTASPISDDIPALVRSLAGTTALTLGGEPILVGGQGLQDDVERRVRVLEQLWLNSLWGGGRS
jgi:hypothetical protein